MEEQKGIYQITWTNSDEEITSISLHQANSPKDALRWEPDYRKNRKWRRSVSLMNDERLRSLLGLLGMHMHGPGDLRVWFNVTISSNVDGAYEAYKGAVVHS